MLRSFSFAVSAYSHSGGCHTGSAAFPITVRVPRGVTNFHSDFPYSSVVPLATAAGALSTVSFPTMAHRWRSCRETTSRKPLALDASARLRVHARLSARDLKL